MVLPKCPDSNAWGSRILRAVARARKQGSASYRARRIILRVTRFGRQIDAFARSVDGQAEAVFTTETSVPILKGAIGRH